MIYLKSEKEVLGISKACAIWKKVKAELRKYTKPGISTKELDQIAADVIQKNGASCSFYQYQNFPGHICISVNEQLIHGIPSDYILKKSDIVKFDIGVTFEGYVCDAAFSVVLDNNNQEALEIQEAAKDCLRTAIDRIKAGVRIGDISYAIQETAFYHGYEVIKDYGGHGCGLKVHEDPIILNYGQPGTGIKLKAGMVLCIEPMLMTESDKYVVDPQNGWTVSAANGKLTCHEEHMVLVTELGCHVLTAD
ncbi:MAG: type I methionyl aminopeptidase [Mycoplasmoidaceae bacterium]